MQNMKQSSKKTDTKSVPEKVKQKVKEKQLDAETIKKNMADKAPQFSGLASGGYLSPGISIVGEGKTGELSKSSEIAVTDESGTSFVIPTDISQKLIKELHITRSDLDQMGMDKLNDKLQKLDNVPKSGDIRKTIDHSLNKRDINKDNIDKLTKHQIMVHEGVVLRKYNDSLDYPHIGIGHLIKEGEDISSTITFDQAMNLYQKDYKDHKEKAKSIPGFKDISPVRKSALIDMVFNLGQRGVTKFRGMLGALQEKDYGKAADEALDSKWADQVGSRAQRIAKLIETGDPAYFNTGEPQVIARHGAYFTGNGTAPIDAKIHPNEMVVNGGQFENFLTKIIKSVEENIKSVTRGEKSGFDNLLGKEKELRHTEIEREVQQYQEKLEREQRRTSEEENNNNDKPVIIDSSVNNNVESDESIMGQQRDQYATGTMTEVESSLDKLVANLFSPSCLDNSLYQSIEYSVFESPNKHFFY